MTFLYDILEKLVFESHAGAAKGGRESKTGMAFTKDRVVNFFADRIEHSDIAITVFSDPVCLQCGTARIKGIVYFLEITWFYDIIRIEDNDIIILYISFLNIMYGFFESLDFCALGTIHFNDFRR